MDQEPIRGFCLTLNLLLDTVRLGEQRFSLKKETL
jgi:hypothetical protein